MRREKLVLKPLSSHPKACLEAQSTDEREQAPVHDLLITLRIIDQLQQAFDEVSGYMHDRKKFKR